MSDVQNKIKNLVESNPIVIFMKGQPEAPMCGFSAQAIQVLKASGATTPVGVDVMSDPEIRQGIKEFTQWPTIPQIFIQGEFIGGCDIVTEMFERGELQPLVQGALKG
ncbi:MAG: Grx4 family monothiol glutaredoxin [Deltaproteobacteria bacterium]|nr:Grx4 family monothiol glutaredoxin [Deltaproteobacteria bacterium]